MLRLRKKEHIYYTINLETILHFKDANLVENTTEYVWKYCNIEKKESENWVVTLNIVETKNTNAHDTEATTAFGKMLNKPLENLTLLLNYNGIPTKVLNKEEILFKWKKIKEQLRATEKEKPELENVIAKSDSDFQHPINGIRMSLLYFLFFSPVYFDTRNKTRKFNYPSVVNAGEILTNSVQQKLTTSNINECVFSLICEHNNYGFLNLEKKYAKELSNYLTTPFNYSFKFNATNTYDRQTGLLKSSVAKIREQASDEFYHTHDINIQQKTN